ncbi:MAG: serine/threonine-protein kinase [Polyangiaceae bacterium]
MTQAKRPPPRSPHRAASETKPGSSLKGFSFIDKRYALELLLGRGGMGEVWSAYDRKLGRRVALKLVPFEGADIDDAPARLEREYQVSKHLVGPAFAEVYAYGVHQSPETSERRAYLVMELLYGETLHARLERKGRLSVNEARDCLRGMAVALRIAHEKSIVHRDLKPANVFFARPRGASSGVQALDGRSEIVKLLDFGIAKETWSTSRLTLPGMLVGSSQYMSPEQIGAHDEIDTRSDLWSLSVLLFRAITGERPFKGSNAEVFARILQEAPPRATVLDPSLPRGLDTFFRRGLEKHPTMRFQTIDELVEGFEGAIRTTARTPSGPLELDITWDDGHRIRPSSRAPALPEAERPTRADLHVARAAPALLPEARLSVEIDVDVASIAPPPRAEPVREPSAHPSIAVRRTIRALSVAVVVLVAAVVVLAALFLYRYR